MQQYLWCCHLSNVTATVDSPVTMLSASAAKLQQYHQLCDGLYGITTYVIPLVPRRKHFNPNIKASVTSLTLAGNWPNIIGCTTSLTSATSQTVWQLQLHNLTGCTGTFASDPPDGLPASQVTQHHCHWCDSASITYVTILTAWLGFADITGAFACDPWDGWPARRSCSRQGTGKGVLQYGSWCGIWGCTCAKMSLGSTDTQKASHPCESARAEPGETSWVSHNCRTCTGMSFLVATLTVVDGPFLKPGTTNWFLSISAAFNCALLLCTHK